MVSDCFSSSSSSSSDRTPSPTAESHPSPAKRKAGRIKFRETRHPVYHGVRARNGGKWVCEVREPHKKSRIWLGTYPTPEMAARAHDVAVLALRGDSAPLNFPDSRWTMPAARSSRADEIRRAAAEGAEMYRPSKSSGRRASAVEIGVGGVVLSTSGMATPVVFIDEEEMFNMPELLVEMAAGLLITPPAVLSAFEWDSAEWMEVGTTLWHDD